VLRRNAVGNLAALSHRERGSTAVGARQPARVSLYWLAFDEGLAGLLQVCPKIIDAEMSGEGDGHADHF
jgi:hypothetical protein